MPCLKVELKEKNRQLPLKRTSKENKLHSTKTNQSRNNISNCDKRNLKCFKFFHFHYCVVKLIKGSVKKTLKYFIITNSKILTSCFLGGRRVFNYT
jgi:hypothetical protein